MRRPGAILSAMIFLSACLAPAAFAGNEAGARVGVIRWDAWVGDLDSSQVGENVGLQVEASLGPSRFHDRLPFYARELSATSVQVRGTTQAIVDAELAYANAAGIDFWAFVYYPPNSALDLGRKLYKSSLVKGRVKFAHIIEGHKSWAFAELMADFERTDYQRVLGNRPLLFILSQPGDVGYTRAEIEGLRSSTRGAGLPNPYIVLMNSDSGEARAHADSLGADAISAYVTPGSGGISFAALSDRERALWEMHAVGKSKVVPWVTTGWDPRPRIEHPVSWTAYAADGWAERASASQIAEQLLHATRWVASHADTSEAAVIMMYAWNEFDEGGWVCPTLHEGTARIDALADVLRYSASSTRDESQTARKAFDGSKSTAWQAADRSRFAGQWIEVDFGTHSSFSQLRVSEPVDRTGRFRIQYRTGDVWRDAWSGTGIGAGRTITFPEVRSRRARLLFDSGIGTPAISELEIDATPAAQASNLALGRSYDASSTRRGRSHDGTGAFDGDPETYWQAAARLDFSDQWLEVRFGDITTFNAVHIDERGARTRAFRIEYWANGWRTAYRGRGIGDHAEISFPPVTGTRARIRFESGSGAPVIQEFGVYMH